MFTFRVLCVDVVCECGLDSMAGDESEKDFFFKAHNLLL
jgi:hypothetical protein